MRNFHSLQGESTFAGLPCIFIRLSGCNLSCSWCDTRYANEEYHSMTFDQILKKVSSYNCNLIEVTGGEPLLQNNTPALISILLKKNYQVLLETNGSKSIKNIASACIKIIDIKCPSSNESDSFLSENISFLTEHDEIKFVIGSRKDYEFAKSIIKNELPKISQKKIHISPVFGQIPLKAVAAWMIEDNLLARLSLQQHKIVWDPDKRGV
ncbi:radical SAM protein [Desulfobacula sp.]|uniref:7-carboxy-7-deazaguanine synthase QueE n=1 Tax=Desulfobacula sp. TaxID=2593537 RepID=UPI002638CECA|nr:radical SAM protein [Desulfobacula sp.]